MDDPTKIQSSPRAVVLVVLGALVQVASIVPIPFLVRRIFDDVLVGDSDSTELFVTGLALVALQVTSAAATVLIRSAVATVAAANSARMRTWFHDLLLDRSLQSIREHDDAELLQAPEVVRAGTSKGSIHFVARIQQLLRQIAAVLAGDPGNDRPSFRLLSHS